MTTRKDEIKEFAKFLGKLEKQFNVKVISDNGYTNASIIDLVSSNDYLYISTKGEIIESY